MPKISVIVPVYKAEKYLDRCVDSILAQTFGDFELILVDDGSPDGCPAMCDVWAEKDSRIRVIHQKNSGPSAARNAGIRCSEGTFLTFVDSDDLISPEMLEHLYNMLVSTGADIALCELMTMPERSAIPKPPKGKEKVYVYSQERFMDLLLKIHSNKTVHYVCGKMLKRNVVDDHFFPECFKLGEDVLSTFKGVMRSNKVVMTPNAYYFYYDNPNSITRKRFDENYLLLRDVWKRVLDISKRYAPQYKDKVLFNLRRMDFTILTQSILHGDSETDRKYKNELALCLKRLRHNMCRLLSGPMVIRRKIAVLAAGCFYYPIRGCYRLIVRLHLMKRSRR